MKRTLKRELKVLEIVEGKELEAVSAPRLMLSARVAVCAGCWSAWVRREG